MTETGREVIVYIIYTNLLKIKNSFPHYTSMSNRNMFHNVIDSDTCIKIHFKVNIQIK